MGLPGLLPRSLYFRRYWTLLRLHRWKAEDNERVSIGRQEHVDNSGGTIDLRLLFLGLDTRGNAGGDLHAGNDVLDDSVGYNAWTPCGGLHLCTVSLPVEDPQRLRGISFWGNGWVCTVSSSTLRLF